MRNEPSSTDAAYMSVALRLAERGLGRVWPNPAVGCVLVRGNRIIGRGWTQPGGRPHAETEALRRAGPLARGSTAYVTLEPCAHQGQTPPCAQALITAGISRCVVALRDPDPRVAGKGLAALEAAGIAVELGIGADRARDINVGFLGRVERNRPLVTVKLATTLDGKIASHTGESQWITGPRARRAGHYFRALNDAIAVGSGTALADDPMLTCRIPGLEKTSPIRMVFDSRLKLPLTAKLVSGATDHPTWIFALADSRNSDRWKALEDCGVTLFGLEPDDFGYPDLSQALGLMAERGLTRILVEGGGHLVAAFLQKNLVDRIAWFRAPTVMGGDGVPAVRGFGLEKLMDMPRFGAGDRLYLGDDVLEVYSLCEREKG